MRAGGSQSTPLHTVAPSVLTVAAALTALLWPAAPALAQVPRWEVEAGGSRLQYDTLDALNGPSLTGLLEWDRPALLARLSSGATGFGDNGWSIQGQGELAGWLAPAGRDAPLRLEVGASAAGSRHSLGFDAYVGRTDLRFHLLGAWAGAWAGLGATIAKSSLDEESLRGVLPSVGAWVRGGPARVTLSYLHTTLEGEAWPEANLSVSMSTGPVDLTAFGGVRRTPFPEVEKNEAWAGASAALWLDSRLAIVASAGEYPSDLLQGIPGGEYFSFGIRLTRQRVRPVPPEVPIPLIFSRDRAESGRITFRVPDAARVEIAGDWNDWNPTPLERASADRWRLPAGIPPGVYRFNLLVDGDRWLVPDDIPAMDDGFGGTVGLLVISPD